MRNLGHVIDQMLEIIPESETSLIADLKSRKSSAFYGSPESQPHFWRQTANILYSTLGNPTDGWQKQCQHIFNGTQQEKVMRPRIRTVPAHFEENCFQISRGNRTTINKFLEIRWLGVVGKNDKGEIVGLYTPESLRDRVRKLLSMGATNFGANLFKYLNTKEVDEQ